MSGFGIVRMKTDESRKAGVSRSVPGNGLVVDRFMISSNRLLALGQFLACPSLGKHETTAVGPNP